MKTREEIEAMSDEARAIKTHELCGFRLFKWVRGAHSYSTWLKPKEPDPDTGSEYFRQRLNIPDYLNSLDAMHGAVMSISNNMRDLVNLKLEEETRNYFDHCETQDLDDLVNADARTRNLVFLMVML